MHKKLLRLFHLSEIANYFQIPSYLQNPPGLSLDFRLLPPTFFRAIKEEKLSSGLPDRNAVKSTIFAEGREARKEDLSTLHGGTFCLILDKKSLSEKGWFGAESCLKYCVHLVKVLSLEDACKPWSKVVLRWTS